MKFAIVGTNWISDNFIDGAKHSGDFEPFAVCSRSMERGKAFADKYGIKRVYDSFDAMLKDGEIECVYIASPTAAHKAHAILALGAKKHVLCEKSIASSLSEFLEIEEAAKKNAVLLMEAMRSVFIPGFSLISENIGRLGQVRSANFSYGNYSSRYDSYKEGTILNAFDPTLSNGALIDIGVYCVAAAARLFGMPEEIYSAAFKLPGSIDGCGATIAKYGDKIVNMSYSKIATLKVPSEIAGEDMTMLIDSITSPREITLVDRKTGGREILKSNQDKPDMYYEVQKFIDLVKSGAMGEKEHEYSKITLSIMDKARALAGIDFKK